MTYVWDTNILLLSLRSTAFFEQINNEYHFFEPQNQTIISSVTIGEIHAIGFRNRWDLNVGMNFFCCLKN